MARNFMRRRQCQVYGNISNSLKTDVLSLSYYLYLFVSLENGNTRDINLCVELFYKLAAKFNVLPQLEKYLNAYKQKLILKGDLRPLDLKKTRESDDLYEDDDDFENRQDRLKEKIFNDGSKKLGDIRIFYGTDIAFEYRVDYQLERFYSSEFLKLPGTIDLCRCCICGDEDFLLKLIENFLLRKRPCEELTSLQTVPAHIEKALNDFSSIQFLIDEIGISDIEAKIILFLYRMETNSEFSELMEVCSYEFKTLMLSRMLNIPVGQINIIIKSSEKLSAFDFITKDFCINSDLCDCINSRNLDFFFTDLIREEKCDKTYELDSYNVDEKSKNIMQVMLKGKEGVNLLLYGKPGSGKTEFAKSLAKHSGKKILVFKNEAEVSRNTDGTNVFCRLNCFLSLDKSDSVIIVDEADSVLTTVSGGFFSSKPSVIKGTVNKMLEKSANKVIWIVNFTNQMDESTRRRFNYSYYFESMTAEQLRTIASEKLKELKFPKEFQQELLKLFDKYNVTGASVDNVLKTLRAMKLENKELLLDYVEAVLKENSHLIYGKSKMREFVNSTYDTTVLNSSMDPETIVTMVKNANQYSLTHKNAESGIRMLFYGVSGCGKTEFARYIAQCLNKKLLLKRASDILDKYVGGSEKNIKQAFEEAETNNQILLFDEADSFFASRDSAEHSWERTQVNEFLTQMEEFPGIVICTTNLKKIMDPALNRRFHMMVEFKPMDKTGILTLLKKYFSEFTFTDNQVRELLLCKTVTPGDFGILSSKIRFMNPEEVSSQFIIDELINIQCTKENKADGRRVGFCA